MHMYILSISPISGFFFHSGLTKHLYNDATDVPNRASVAIKE